MGPFVDYTKPKGSFGEFVKHDLIVNEVSLFVLLPSNIFLFRTHVKSFHVFKC